MTESALLFDQMPDLPPLQVELGEAKGGWPRASQVPLRVTFPMDAITMLPQEGGYGAVLELRIAALDENGNRSDLDVLPVRLQGPEPPEPGDRGSQEVALELRRRPQEVIVSLYDPMSGNVLMSKVDYDP